MGITLDDHAEWLARCAAPIEQLSPSEKDEAQMYWLRKWLCQKAREKFDLKRRWKHGTYGGYRWGCRCELCEKAWRIQRAIYTEEARLRRSA